MKSSVMKLTKFTMLLLLSLFITGCTNGEDVEVENNIEDVEVSQDVEDSQESGKENLENEVDKEDSVVSNGSNLGVPDTDNYRLIEVDGGDTSGHREANVVVNIGHGNREYWAYTNEHGQLVRVTAKNVILQNDETEDVNSSGRYYSSMADVPGVGEKYGNDRGHVLADSLGGVSNAYNITPQDATLNRHGDQAYMERNIREAGGATDFEAIITYPNTTTQVPSHYEYTYTIKGNKVNDSFPNGDPDKINEDLGLSSGGDEPNSNSSENGEVSKGDLDSVDTNGNGRVTIQEAKDAGFSMPIYEDHWLYEYMTDSNSNGMVGE